MSEQNCNELEIIYTENKISGVKILNPDLEMQMHSDVLGVEMIVKASDIVGTALHVQSICSPTVLAAVNRFAFAWSSWGEQWQACLLPCKAFHQALFARNPMGV